MAGDYFYLPHPVYSIIVYRPLTVTHPSTNRARRGTTISWSRSTRYHLARSPCNRDQSI